MLKKPTVLVLGAGASKPFSFPTGIELSELLVKQLRPGRPPFNALRNLCGHTAEEISDFRESFFYSGKNSVDAFLEHRADYVPIGKAATAALLIPFENPAQPFQYHDENWLRYLYNNLNTSFDEFGSNKLSLVTFNYDRSVEHFFFTSLQNTYKKSSEDVRVVLSKISIIHLHGVLGPLPWQSKNSRPYTPEVTKEALTSAIDNIKIIHEDIRDGRDKEFERAKNLMNEAEQILFMGFGYNRTNLERLGVRGLKRPALGTHVGLSDHERSVIRSYCQGTIHLVPGGCMDFVRDRIEWD